MIWTQVAVTYIKRLRSSGHLCIKAETCRRIPAVPELLIENQQVGTTSPIQAPRRRSSEHHTNQRTPHRAKAKEGHQPALSSRPTCWFSMRGSGTGLWWLWEWRCIKITTLPGLASVHSYLGVSILHIVVSTCWTSSIASLSKKRHKGLLECTRGDLLWNENIQSIQMKILANKKWDSEGDEKVNSSNWNLGKRKGKGLLSWWTVCHAKMGQNAGPSSEMWT